MSDLIVKIGDDALDLSVDETIAITKQAAKVGDFSTVLADGTNEVTVPLTPKNQLIMDNAHLIPSDSAKPYGRLDATLIQEGYETIQDGYAIIKSSADNFSLQVVGGNASFFNLIKDLNVRELDFSDYDHFWINQNVFDRRNETDGLVYAIFEQSLDDFTMDEYAPSQYAVNTDQILPSFYVKSIIEKIFSERGYSFVTDLVSEDIYDKAVAFRAKIPNRGTIMDYHECTVRNEGNYTIIDPILTPYSFFNASIDPNSHEYASSAELVDSIDGGTGKFVFTDSCTATVSFNIIISSPYLTNIYIDVFYTTANGIVNFQTEEVSVGIGTSTYDATFTINVTEYEGEIYFRSKVLSTVLPSVQVLIDSTFTVSNVTLIENTTVTQSFPYNYITGVLPCPDMKQADLLKEMARIYQWVFDTNELTHTVTARRFDQIKDRISQAIDLSEKIDARRIKTTFGIDGFAQTNALRYKEDDITKYDAVGYINVADTTLNAEKDYVKMSQFAASSTRLRFDTVNAPYVPMFEGNLPTNGLTDRIFLVRRVTPFAANINFARVGDTPSNIPTDDVTFAYFAEAGNSDSLDFPTLIERFYQTVIDMNDRGKSIECDMNLNIKDVMNYDPLTPVYIQHFGNYFYWEKLSNYVKDKLTKCKFVKI